MKTGNDGSFAFRSLPDGSGANLDILAPGYARERKFNIPAGSEQLVFKLKPEARIQGRVTFGETGETAEGEKVSARGVDPATSAYADSQTDNNGRYTLSNLPPGKYDCVCQPKSDPFDLRKVVTVA